MQCPRIFGLPNIYTESIELIECHGLMHHTRIHDKRTHTHTHGQTTKCGTNPKALTVATTTTTAGKVHTTMRKQEKTNCPIYAKNLNVSKWME